MAAISNTLFTLLAPGDRVVSVKDTYGGTNKLFIEFLPRIERRTWSCATPPTTSRSRPRSREAAELVYLETPTNPTLKVIDIARLAAAAHAAGAIVVVDNTFATPINQNPLALGADLVLHSATKFLGGHADALGGVVCGDPELVAKVYHYREITGATLDPMAAYLLLRGMKTLDLRIRQQNESALRIARWLQEQPAVAAVFYPGLETHVHHDVARARCAASAACSASCSRAASTRSSACCRGCAARTAPPTSARSRPSPARRPPPATSSARAEERAAMGIPEGLIRYSVGIEDTDDLIADLAQAFAAD